MDNSLNWVSLWHLERFKTYVNKPDKWFVYEELYFNEAELETLQNLLGVPVFKVSKTCWVLLQYEIATYGSLQSDGLGTFWFKYPKHPLDLYTVSVVNRTDGLIDLVVITPKQNYLMPIGSVEFGWRLEHSQLAHMVISAIDPERALSKWWMFSKWEQLDNA